MGSVLGETRAPAGAAARWGGVLLVATAVAVDPAGLRPFSTLRWAVVGVAAALAAASAPWRVPRRFAWGWAALGACLAGATAVALDPVLAVLGHPRRHLGLLGWLVFALAFAAGTAVRREGLRHLGRAAALAAVATGAAALADLAGWDPAGVTFAGGRVGGLVGQPVYLGALTLLLTPLAAAVALDPREPSQWRTTAAIGAATCAAALLATQTRGAWLGAAAAATLALSTHVHRRRAASAHAPPAGDVPVVDRGAAYRVGSPVRVGVAAVGLLVVLALAGPVGARLAAAADPSAAGGRGRLDEWVLARRVIADHPVTGVGPEGYRIAAPGHIDAGYTRRHGRDDVVDRAHDGPLDVAVAAGLPAAAVYVGLVGGVVLAAVRVERRGRSGGHEPVAVGAALALVAWATQQLVSFPLAEIDPAAWLLAGVVVVAAAGDPYRRPARRTDLARRALAAALAGGLAVAGVTAVAADRDLERSRQTGDVAAADRATRLRPDDVDAWYVAAQVAASGPSILAVDAGLDRVEAGLGREPDDPALADLHERLLADRALRSGLDDDLRVAIAASRARIAADPANPTHRRLLAAVTRVTRLAPEER
jgi:O-Antigen ligase